MKARAYCSSANLGTGFDIVAVALDAFYDEVEIKVKEGKGEVLTEFHGPYSSNISPQDNTAILAAKLILMQSNRNVDVEIKVWKGIPLGLGLGGSGATAVAVAKALTEELKIKIGDMQIAKIAGIAERAAAGSAHYDNVTASLLGGLIVIYSFEPLKALKFNPNGLFVLGIPEVKTPIHKTEIMRAITPKSLSLDLLVQSLAKMASFMAGLYSNSLELIGMAMEDKVVEPSRASVTPAYDKLKKYSREAGAYGFTISGAGPSVIALVNESNANHVAKAMREAYEEEGIDAKVIVTKVADGCSVFE